MTVSDAVPPTNARYSDSAAANRATPITANRNRCGIRASILPMSGLRDSPSAFIPALSGAVARALQLPAGMYFCAAEDDRLVTRMHEAEPFKELVKPRKLC